MRMERDISRARKQARISLFWMEREGKTIIESCLCSSFRRAREKKWNAFFRFNNIMMMMKFLWPSFYQARLRLQVFTEDDVSLATSGRRRESFPRYSASQGDLSNITWKETPSRCSCALFHPLREKERQFYSLMNLPVKALFLRTQEEHQRKTFLNTFFYFGFDNARQTDEKRHNFCPTGIDFFLHLCTLHSIKYDVHVYV